MRNTDALEAEFCSNSFFETVDNLRHIHDNEIPDIYRDLFLEERK